MNTQTLLFALVAWTLLALVVWIFTRIKRVHPLVQVMNVRALLVMLPLSLALSQLSWFSLGLKVEEKLVQMPMKSAVQIVQADRFESGKKPSVLLRAEEAPTFQWNEGTFWQLFLWLNGAIWLLGALRLIRDRVALWQFQKQLETANSEALTCIFTRMAFEANVPVNRVQLRLSEAEVPMTFGIFRPTIVLPKSLLESEKALEMALLHELVHIKRHDVAWHLFGRVMGVVFGIHPLVWVLQKQMESACEQVCDIVVLRSERFHVSDYAQLLFRLSGQTPVQPTLRSSLQMADTFQHLRMRFETMKNIQENPKSFQKIRIVASLFAFGCVTLLSVAIAANKVDQRFVFPAIPQVFAPIVESPNQLDLANEAESNTETQVPKMAANVAKTTEKVVTPKSEEAQREEYVFYLRATKVNGLPMNVKADILLKDQNENVTVAALLGRIGTIWFSNFQRNDIQNVRASIRENRLIFNLNNQRFVLESETNIFPNSRIKSDIWVALEHKR